MEENVLLSNIATIIVKDILIDEVNNSKQPKQQPNSVTDIPCLAQYPLLESDDDEAFTFFMRQQRLLNTTTQTPQNRKKRSAECTSRGAAEPQHKRPPTANHTGKGTEHKRFELNLLNSFGAVEFESHLHMSKMSFLKTFQSMRQFLLTTELPATTPPQTVFSLALWKLATDEHFEQIGRKFRIPLNICQQAIRQFWRLISAHYESFIQWPNSLQKCHYNIQNFQAYTTLRSFQQLFGVVAIKRLDVFLEDDNAEVPIILQIICDSDQKVIDCFLEMAHSYTFDASPIAQTLALNTHALPVDSYLIGGECFPLKSYLMRPFETASDSREQAFNAALQPALRTAQQVLDAMAKRFNTLYALEAKDLQEVRKIVETVCALHNLCVEIEDDYVERKQEEMQFDWAKMNNDLNIKGNEQDPQGRQRRVTLMKGVISQ